MKSWRRFLRGKWSVLAAAAVLGVLGLAAVGKWWVGGPPKGGDPRLTFPTPYRNVKPDVQYVGDRACADCHGDISESYHQHPMGQGLAPVASATPIERFEAEAHNP